jgi:hypothetical protein
MRHVTKKSAENVIRDVDATTVCLLHSAMWFYGTRATVISVTVINKVLPFLRQLSPKLQILNCIIYRYRIQNLNRICIHIFYTR